MTPGGGRWAHQLFSKTQPRTTAPPPRAVSTHQPVHPKSCPPKTCPPKICRKPFSSLPSSLWAGGKDHPAPYQPGGGAAARTAKRQKSFGTCLQMAHLIGVQTHWPRWVRHESPGGGVRQFSSLGNKIVSRIIYGVIRIIIL